MELLEFLSIERFIVDFKMSFFPTRSQTNDKWNKNRTVDKTERIDR